MLKIHRAAVTEGDPLRAPGEIIKVTKKDFTINCKEGALAVKQLQLEGKKTMPSDAFLRGYNLTEGTVLGS